MSHLKNIKALFPEPMEASFEENELAFLSLTKKVEGELRDKISWLLHKNTNPAKLIIREWNRHDLVIMNNKNQKLESIIEFKNQLGFTIKTDEYKKALCGDLYKSAVSIRNNESLDTSEIIFVMFGRTLDNTPNINDPNALHAMKYLGTAASAGAYRDCNQLPTQPIIYQEQFDMFKENWGYWLDQAYIPEEKRIWDTPPIKGGNFLNIGIKIITSIIGPFNAQEVFDLNSNCWQYPLTKKGLLELPRQHLYRDDYQNKN